MTKQYQKIIFERHTINHLIDSNTPNIALIEAVLAGHISGRVWVDDNHSPKSCFIITGGEYCFFLGEYNEYFFKKALIHVGKKSTFRLFPEFICSDFDGNAIFSNVTVKRTPRVNFLLPKKNHEIFNIKMPDLVYKSCVVRINRSNIKKCIWANKMKAIYLNNVNLEKNNIGLCIIYNNTVIAESYSIVGEGHVEIGVIVKPEYRGQGMGEYMCRILIKAFHDENLQMCWTCDVDNYASQKLAKKLGFTRVGSYVFFDRV